MNISSVSLPLQEKLMEVFHYILPPLPSNNSPTWSDGSLWFPGALLTREDFIIGALEQAMNDMVRLKKLLRA